MNRLTTTYDGPNLEPTPPDLQDGEKEHIIIFQDESTVHANDYQSDMWHKEGEQVLKSKSRGRLEMVSGLICEAMGPLGLKEEAKKRNLLLPEKDRLPEKAEIIIAPTSKAGGDSYWNMDQMITQVRPKSFCDSSTLTSL